MITSIHAKPLHVFGAGNTLNVLRTLSHYYVTCYCTFKYTLSVSVHSYHLDSHKKKVLIKYHLLVLRQFRNVQSEQLNQV